MPLEPQTITEAARALKAASPPSSERIIEALAQLCREIRTEPSALSGLAGRVATCTGQSRALLAASLERMLAPFTVANLARLPDERVARDSVVGLIVPGNVAGAGLHELARALIAGAAVVIKVSSREPEFFAWIRSMLVEMAPEVAARLAVFNWDRGREDLTRAMASNCDMIAAMGDDVSMAALGRLAGDRLVTFGAALSVGYVGAEAGDPSALATSIATDVTLFDQRGCLSMRHLFVDRAYRWPCTELAGLIGRELERLALEWPPPRLLSLYDAVPVRAAREVARWRRLGGEPVELWEGSHLSWTVILDPDSDLRRAPICRTLSLSEVDGVQDFVGRLGASAMVVEGLAVAGISLDEELSQRLAALGVSYICPIGQLQAPPPWWNHGGGRFIKALAGQIR